MIDIGHKDYTIQPEEFSGLLPSSKAIEVSDMFKEGKSAADVQGKLRVNDRKIAESVILTVYGHIKEIENTVVNMLNGTSLVYFPLHEDNQPIVDPETGVQLVDENNELMFEEGDHLWDAPDIPTSKEELLRNVMLAVQLDGGNYANVYDASFEELTSQISHIIDNIISCQRANGSGTFSDLYKAITGKNL